MHNPIHINHIGFILPHKTCFNDFSTLIHAGDRIGIIGRNGSGKSSLLQILAQQRLPSSGEVISPAQLQIGYLPQMIENSGILSGSQQLQVHLTTALNQGADILLLDEPTNHLDQHNKQALLRLLDNYSNTLIIVSHDEELLASQVNQLWYIDNEKINIFIGHYADFVKEKMQRLNKLKLHLKKLKQEQKNLHQALMQEQVRAATSKRTGKKNIKNRKWPTVVNAAKAGRANQTFGEKTAKINEEKHHIQNELMTLQIPEVIQPKFQLLANQSNKLLAAIRYGILSSDPNKILLQDIHFSIYGQDRIALLGSNGSGKSSLVKALLNPTQFIIEGEWQRPDPTKVGYLDQHYQLDNYANNMTVYDYIAYIVPRWSPFEIRSHLNDFLFRKNEEVNITLDKLSGGERVRFCLAAIAAKTPSLLILDEITNNLDSEMKEHVIMVLQDFPGALLIISHDETFLQRINLTQRYVISQQTLMTAARE